MSETLATQTVVPPPVAPVPAASAPAVAASVPDDLFTTLEQVRDEHARLLDADSGDELPGRDYWLDVHRFATRVAQSGIYFNEPHEIKACQGYLSYWQRELSQARLEKRFTDDIRVPELKPYDESALRALQSAYPTNPFEGFAADVRAIGSGRELPTDKLADLIEHKAAQAGLRFELDLAKEIANQAAGDPFAPTLLEFCLYHLFEDPETRVGNKLRRPLRAKGFGCAAYLTAKSEQLYSAQERPEKRALLDALARFGAKYDPRSPSEVMPWDDIEAIRGAASPTFRGPRGVQSRLRAFLTDCRLVFEATRGVSIVHPAIFRRWPELLSEIRLQKERSRRRRRFTYGAVMTAAVVGALAFGMFVQERREQRLADEANQLATASYSKTGADRVRTGLEAMQRSPTRRARTALNDAVGAMLGANATDVRDKKAAGPPMALLGRAASIEPCAASQPEGPRCFVDGRGRRVALPDLVRSDIRFGESADGTLVAVAWPTSRGRGGTAERVGLAMYRVGTGDVAEPVGSVRESRCTGTVDHVRVSRDGLAVTVDCVPADDGEKAPLWDVFALREDAARALPTPVPDAQSGRFATSGLYFGSPGVQGHAVLREGGVLETVSEKGVRREQHSDILRVAGRPDHVTFHPDRGFAVLGALDAPLALVHEQRGEEEEGRDDLYAVPKGLGAPFEIDYSPEGTCIEVRTVNNDGQLLAYHIVLDDRVLMDIARPLVAGTPSYHAAALCGFPVAAR